MIHLQGVCKRFGKRVAVRDVTLHVPRGCIYGMLGHNGAGKSTLMGILLGQVFPDAGTITIDGHNVFRARDEALAHVGAIYETPAFYDYLSGMRNLHILCSYTGRVSEARLNEVIALVGLTERIHDRVRTYSHGMRQRLALAQALLPDPKVLILDEPSDGLDPQGIHEMRQLMYRLNREWGLTIIFSSHQLHEVEHVADLLAIMHQGHLLFEGRWQQEQQADGWIRLRADRQEEAVTALRSANLVGKAAADGRLELLDGHDVAGINHWLIERGFRVQSISPVVPSLEEFYLRTVGYWPAGTEPASSTREAAYRSSEAKG